MFVQQSVCVLIRSQLGQWELAVSFFQQSAGRVSFVRFELAVKQIRSGM